MPRPPTLRPANVARAFNQTKQHKLPTTPHFRVHHVNGYVGRMLHNDYIYHKAGSVLINIANESDRQRPRRGLWWNVQCPLAVSRKAAVRVWCKRRTRVAFRAALVEQGLDYEGLPRAEGGRGLRGTLSITCQVSTVTASFVDLVAASKRLVKGLLARYKPGG